MKLRSISQFAGSSGNLAGNDAHVPKRVEHRQRYPRSQPRWHLRFASANRFFVAATVLISVGLTCCFAAPNIDSAVTSPFRPAKTLTIRLNGESWGGPTELWTSFPARAFRQETPPGSAQNELTFELFVPADLPIGIGAVRVGTTNGPSELQLVMLDHLPPVAKSSANGTMDTAQELPLPACIDGFGTPRAFDYFKLNAAKGARLSVEILANRLGSPFDPVLRLLDESGRELIYCDDAPGVGADARFSYQVAEAGTYFIEVRDTRYQGGPKYFYRLRAGDFPLQPIPFLPLQQLPAATRRRADLPEIAESEPNDKPGAAQEIQLPARLRGGFTKVHDRDYYQFEAKEGEQWVFKTRTRSLGSACDVYMQLSSAGGSVLAEPNLTGPEEAALTNKFNETGRYTLMIEELNRRGGAEFDYELDVERHMPGFELSVETDNAAAAAGGTFELEVKCARRDYNGPIQLRLDGLPEAFESSNMVLGEKTNSTTLKVTLPPHLAPGRLLHFSVIGSAEISGRTVTATASTMTALRRRFPLLLYPPEHLDGLIALGIKPEL